MSPSLKELLGPEPRFGDLVPPRGRFRLRRPPDLCESELEESHGAENGTPPKTKKQGREKQEDKEW